MTELGLPLFGDDENFQLRLKVATHEEAQRHLLEQLSSQVTAHLLEFLSTPTEGTEVTNTHHSNYDGQPTVNVGNTVADGLPVPVENAVAHCCKRVGCTMIQYVKAYAECGWPPHLAWETGIAALVQLLKTHLVPLRHHDLSSSMDQSPESSVLRWVPLSPLWQKWMGGPSGTEGTDAASPITADVSMRIQLYLLPSVLARWESALGIVHALCYDGVETVCHPLVAARAAADILAVIGDQLRDCLIASERDGGVSIDRTTLTDRLVLTHHSIWWLLKVHSLVEDASNIEKEMPTMDVERLVAQASQLHVFAADILLPALLARITSVAADSIRSSVSLLLSVNLSHTTLDEAYQQTYDSAQKVYLTCRSHLSFPAPGMTLAQMMLELVVNTALYPIVEMLYDEAGRVFGNHSHRRASGFQEKVQTERRNRGFYAHAEVSLFDDRDAVGNEYSDVCGWMHDESQTATQDCENRVSLPNELQSLRSVLRVCLRGLEDALGADVMERSEVVHLLLCL